MSNGEIVIAPPTMRGAILDVDARLIDFDIDVAGPLKSDHLKFLHEQVIPTLQANPRASVILVGSASRTGPEAHNEGLSERRAAEVRKALGAVDSQILDSAGKGAPKTGPMEDKHDRAVFMFISFHTELEIDFRSDDWSRALIWDDIVGFGLSPSGPLKRLNLQATLKGAPRVWSAGSAGKTAITQPEFTLEAVGKRSGRTIPQHKWSLPQAAESEQPTDMARTIYRLSDTVQGMGFLATPGEKGFVVINRESVPIDFSINASGWSDRGGAQQGVASSADLGRLDARRLMLAGGVEPVRLFGKYDGTMWQADAFVRSPANVLFYSGFSGSGAAISCLSRIGECWLSPSDLLANWRTPFAMEVVILAAPNLLTTKFANGVAMAGPAGDWAKLLASKNAGGPLAAILGYADDAPSTKVVAGIAAQMAESIGGGASGPQLVEAWLSINAQDSGKNTWNAVGIDQRGYFWIGSRDADFRDKAWWTHPLGGGQVPLIGGPATILG